ncbi:unnamed protein product [Arctogadus glacialis]
MCPPPLRFVCGVSQVDIGAARRGCKQRLSVWLLPWYVACPWPLPCGSSPLAPPCAPAHTRGPSPVAPALCSSVPAACPAPVAPPLCPGSSLSVVRPSSIFPILSATIAAAGRSLRGVHGFFCLSNIIGVIVYISAALSDISPKKDEDKKWHYSYGWSFYFGGLSFILAEMVGVLAVNIYIEKNKELRCRSRAHLFKSSAHAMLRLPSYRFRRSRSSSRSTDPPRSPEGSPDGAAKAFAPPAAAPFSVATLPNPHHGGGGGDISMYTLGRDAKLGSLGGGAAPPLYGTVDRAALYQLHNYFPKEGGAGGALGGTLPSLSKSNLAAAAAGQGSAPLSTPGSGTPPQQAPMSTATMERERDRGADRDRGAMGTLDRLGAKRDRDSNSDTLNRKTTPV